MIQMRFLAKAAQLGGCSKSHCSFLTMAFPDASD